MQKEQDNPELRRAETLPGASLLQEHVSSSRQGGRFCDFTSLLPPHAAPVAVGLGLQQLALFFSQLQDQDALSAFVLQSPQWHERFLEHAGNAESLPREKGAEEPELENLLAGTPVDVLQRFVFARLLVDLRPEPAARDVALVAIQRGRFLELLGSGARFGHATLPLFLAGGLSTLDVLCGMALEDVLSLLDPPGEVFDMLLDSGGSDASEQCRHLLQLTQHIENGDWQSCESVLMQYDLDGERAAMLYGKAAVWTRLLLG